MKSLGNFEFKGLNATVAFFFLGFLGELKAQPVLQGTLFWLSWASCAVFSIYAFTITDNYPKWWWLALTPLANLCVVQNVIIHIKNRRVEEAEEVQRKAQEEAFRLDAPRREAEERRLKEEQDRRAADQAQRALSQRLTDSLTDSRQLAIKLTSLVQTVATSIDLAEREFHDRAFVPFWEAVEQAATHLANCEQAIRTLNARAEFYGGEARKLDRVAPPFSLGQEFEARTLPEVSHACDRLRSVVRQAHRDHDFADIFLMCKTNKILVMGFSTLGQTLAELSDRMVSTIENFAATVGIGISDIVSVGQRSASEVATAVERLTEKSTKESQLSRQQNATASAAELEEARKSREIANDTWRNRKPIP